MAEDDQRGEKRYHRSFETMVSSKREDASCCFPFLFCYSPHLFTWILRASPQRPHSRRPPLIKRVRLMMMMSTIPSSSSCLAPRTVTTTRAAVHRMVRVRVQVMLRRSDTTTSRGRGMMLVLRVVLLVMLVMLLMRWCRSGRGGGVVRVGLRVLLLGALSVSRVALLGWVERVRLVMLRLLRVLELPFLLLLLLSRLLLVVIGILLLTLHIPTPTTAATAAAAARVVVLLMMLSRSWRRDLPLPMSR